MIELVWTGEGGEVRIKKEFIGFPVPNIYNFVKAIEAKLKQNT